MTVIELETPHGPARAHLTLCAEPRGAVVLGHGAGGGVSAPDLVVASKAAQSVGFSVVLVEQPYRVAGRRSPAPAAQLDAAWTSVVGQLCDEPLSGLRLIVGGRSSGARVACRTAAATGAAGVLCLAFPLRPPRGSGPPAPSRIGELESVSVPSLVVQGERDPFGIPPPAPTRTVARVRGDHGLKSDPSGIAEAIRAWLAVVLDVR